MQRLLLFLLIAWTTIACSRSACELLLDRADQLMIESPDSSLQLLQQISNRSITDEALQARHAVLYSQARDKNRIDSDCDSLIRIGVRYYENRIDEPDYRARAFYYAGRVHQHAGHINEAMGCYLEAEYSASMDDDAYMKGLIATALGRLYRKQHYYLSSSERFIEAVKHFEAIDKPSFVLQTLMGAAADLYRSGEVEQAFSYWKRSHELATQLQDTTSLLYLARSAATVALDEGRHEEARRLLNEATTRYAQGVIPNDFYLALGEIYLRLGDVDSSALYLSMRLNDYEERLRREKLYDQSSGHWLLENESVASDFFAAMGEYQKAYNRKNRAFQTLDSIYRAEKRSLIPGMRGRFHRQLLEEQNRLLHRWLTLQWLLAAALVLGFIFLVLWLTTRRKQLILEQQQSISAYREQVSRLKDAYMDLQMKPAKGIDPQVVDRRVVFLRQFLDMAVQYGHKHEAFYRQLGQYFSLNDVGGSQWIFEDILNMREPGVVDYLRHRYPQLTDRDVLIYCMIVCDMSKSAICLVLDISVKTYYNLRNMLRGKLDLTNNDITFMDHFNELIAAFTAEKKAEKRGDAEIG